jgi:hypothetical protein
MTAAGPRMFPDPLPEWVLANHRRGAEVRVYRALERQLEEPWHVFYSRPWIGLDRDGREKDGEADFVVAHPDLGILVLEVKGGSVGREERTEKWFSIDSDGFQFSIKNPIQQAVTSKHRLLEKLRDLPGWNGRFVTARHAVVFPSCARPDRDLGPDMPAWLFAGHDEMERLGEWIEERLEQHLPDAPLEPDELDEDGVAIIRDYFSKSFLLERPVGASLIADDEAIRVMTDQQAYVLDIMESVIRIAVPGPAGTGKTALAVEKARRLAGAGRRTLLTCYSRPLARQLERDLGQIPNLHVRSFHGLCSEVAARAGITVVGSGDPPGADYFRSRLPSALIDAVGRMPGEKFDAVVIDEGQDFLETWMPSVEALLRDRVTSPLFIFFDDNQKVFGKLHSIASNVPTNGLRLTRILRSGRTIVQTIQTLIPKPFLPAGPEGQPVEWMEIAGAITDARIEAILQNLIEHRHIAARHIAVVVPDEQYRERIVQGGRIGRYSVANAEAAAGNAVVCDSIRRFKGLERPAILLVEPERVIGEPQLLYVGLTRARILLLLVAPQGALAQLRSLLS